LTDDEDVDVDAGCDSLTAVGVVVDAIREFAWRGNVGRGIWLSMLSYAVLLLPDAAVEVELDRRRWSEARRERAEMRSEEPWSADA
jgi:hypothetical protein